MPVPNENVVNAIFESYLSMRKTHWGTEDKDGKLTIPEKESDAAHKTEICSKILQPASGYLTPKGWLNLIETVHQQEVAEKQYISSLIFYRRWFGTQLLLETLQATRSYLISTYKDSSAYQEYLAKLQKEKRDAGILYNTVKNLPESNKPEDIAKAKKRYDDAIEALKPFDLDDIMKEQKDHVHFFQNNILGHDPLATELEEKTFEDFVKNAMNYKRRKVLCETLLENARTSAEAAETAAEPAKAAAPVAPKVAEVSKPAANTVVTQPIAAPRRSTRHKKAEETTSSSALRSNSTFASSASTKKPAVSRNDDSSSEEEYIVAKKRN